MLKWRHYGEDQGTVGEFIRVQHLDSIIRTHKSLPYVSKTIKEDRWNALARRYGSINNFFCIPSTNMVVPSVKLRAIVYQYCSRGDQVDFQIHGESPGGSRKRAGSTQYMDSLIGTWATYFYLAFDKVVCCLDKDGEWRKCLHVAAIDRLVCIGERGVYVWNSVTLPMKACRVTGFDVRLKTSTSRPILAFLQAKNTQLFSVDLLGENVSNLLLLPHTRWKITHTTCVWCR